MKQNIEYPVLINMWNIFKTHITDENVEAEQL